MPMYRKRPVLIEAIEWTGENLEEIQRLMKAGGLNQGVGVTDGALWIGTLEGVMTATVGDFIIKGVKGELYPCKPDIFKDTYEAIYDIPAI